MIFFIRIISVFALLAVVADLASSFAPPMTNNIRLLPSRLITNIQKHIVQAPLRPYSSSSSFVYSSKNSDSNDNGGNSDSSSINSNQSPSILDRTDKWILRKLIKITNHVPALASIGYFGLISSAGMMKKMPLMENKAATLATVLTKSVGSTTNQEFSIFFSTLITPPSWIFLIWPVISVVQLVTVIYSAIQASRTSSADTEDKAVLKQDDLTALSLSNIMASFWLFASSKATKDCLPLGSVLVLPLVPWLSGYPLRRQTQKEKTTTTIQARTFVFQIYSSFTILAALLALTTELQYGGRIFPSLFGNKPELCAMVFLSLVGFVVSLPCRGVVSKIINTTVLWGILSKRYIDAFAIAASKTGITATTTATTATVILKRNLIPLISLAGSISHITTTILAIVATIKLFNFFSKSE